MSWGKLDDKFHSHPKVAGMDNRMLPAVGLHCLALSWCADQLTDGFVPSPQVARLAGSLLPPRLTLDTIVSALVEAGIWEEAKGGYQLHDYLDYNPSREAVERERAAARERMRGKASPEVRPKQKRSSPEVRKNFTFPVPGVLTEHQGEGADAPCGAGSPAPMSRRKAYALNFFEQHTWLCCGLPTDEEHALREGLTSGTIGRAEVESWQ
jgi:hypothetical protein